MSIDRRSYGTTELAAGLLLGLAAAAGIGRARRSALRPAALLFASLGLALYLGPALTQQLMPRYTLPALVLLAPALAVAVTALTGTERRDPSRPLP